MPRAKSHKFWWLSIASTLARLVQGEVLRVAPAAFLAFQPTLQASVHIRPVMQIVSPVSDQVHKSAWTAIQGYGTWILQVTKEITTARSVTTPAILVWGPSLKIARLAPIPP